MWETYVPIIVAILALIGTVYNANVTRGKQDKSEALAFESRFKDLESGQKLIKQDLETIKKGLMTEDERKCLILVNERVNTILKGLGTFVPEALQNPEHLDAVLGILSNTAAEAGWSAVVTYIRNDLDAEKRTELLAYLEKVSTDKRYKAEKRNWATLYLGLLRLELDREDSNEPVCATAQ
jgi:hypothetical protein